MNLGIHSFYVSSVEVIISYQDTDIVIWNKANNTFKIFIAYIKYLKLLRIYA